MATIRYMLQSKTEAAHIYCRLSINKNTSFKAKTGLLCDAATWSAHYALPKPNSAKNKNIIADLQGLSKALIDAFNDASAKGEAINTAWLKHQIDLHFGRVEVVVEVDESNLLTEAARYYIDELPYKADPKSKKVGVAFATIGKYKNILKKVEQFEAHTKRSYQVKDVDIAFRKAFIKYLSTEQNLTANTIGRYLKFVKTFVLDAQKRGVEVSPQIAHFDGYALKVPKVTLSFDELATLRDTHFTTDRLTIARDWLLIGCYTGQRVSDLLRMNTRMFKQMAGMTFIELEQVKTKKQVQIPLHPEVEAVLKRYGGNFPPAFAPVPASNFAEFNLLIKTVCKQVGLNELTEGNLRDPETKEYKTGKFEKWQLITSHTCRRSFATNFYSLERYPTPLLMNITAHATEKQFLEYIGKKPSDYSLQLAKIWAQEPAVTVNSKSVAI